MHNASVPDSTPMSLGGTRSAAVANELRRLIRSGELPAGAGLRQVDIAERFAVSTTPVREAFASLAKEGLVRRGARGGAVGVAGKGGAGPAGLASRGGRLRAVQRRPAAELRDPPGARAAGD